MATNPSSFGTAGPSQPCLDFRMWRAKEFMRRNLHRRFSLDEVALLTGLSSGRFSHLFRAQCGLAPGQWVKVSRLEEAERLLLSEPELSIKEIAAKVGLAPGRLANEFGKMYGTTPAEYRRRQIGLRLVWSDSLNATSVE